MTVYQEVEFRLLIKANFLSGFLSGIQTDFNLQ